MASAVKLILIIAVCAPVGLGHAICMIEQELGQLGQRGRRFTDSLQNQIGLELLSISGRIRENVCQDVVRLVTGLIMFCPLHSSS